MSCNILFYKVGTFTHPFLNPRKIPGVAYLAEVPDYYNKLNEVE